MVKLINCAHLKLTCVRQNSNGFTITRPSVGHGSTVAARPGRVVAAVPRPGSLYCGALIHSIFLEQFQDMVNSYCPKPLFSGRFRGVIRIPKSVSGAEFVHSTKLFRTLMWTKRHKHARVS